MGSKIRISATIGIAAFILSVIVAIFSRIPFGYIVLRAVLIGACVFGLSLAAFFLIEKQLPELLDSQGDGADSPVIDISIDDNSDTEGPPIPSYASLRQKDEDGDADIVEIVKEVEELDAEELLPEAESADGNTDSVIRPSVSLDELDTLPDMDNLSNTFSTDAELGASQVSEESVAGTGSWSSGSSSAGDPAVLAKAVQTLLKRDQKG